MWSADAPFKPARNAPWSNSYNTSFGSMLTLVSVDKWEILTDFDEFPYCHDTCFWRNYLLTRYFDGMKSHDTLTYAMFNVLRFLWNILCHPHPHSLNCLRYRQGNHSSIKVTERLTTFNILLLFTLQIMNEFMSFTGMASIVFAVSVLRNYSECKINISIVRQICLMFYVDDLG